MSELYDKTEILRPSTASLVLSLCVLAFFVLGLLLSRGESGLTALLVGNDASDALQLQAGQDIQSTINTIFGNQVVGRAVVFGAWAFVGFVTLMSITAIQLTVRNVRQTEAELGYINQDRPRFIHELAEHVLFKLGISLIWGLYMIIFFRFIITFFVAAAYVGIQGDSTAEAYLALLVASIALLLGVHIHVVLARLFAGRVRLWEA